MKPSEEKRLHGKAQIDIPPNDYNWKKNFKKQHRQKLGAENRTEQIICCSVLIKLTGTQ